MIEEYNLIELMVIMASRQLKDNKTIFVGTGLPMAAAILAQKLYTPNLVLIFEAGSIGPIIPRIPISVGECLTFHKAVSASSMSEVMEMAGRGMVDYAFLGGAQIDPFGNLNSTVIGNYYSPKVRFPGSGGANDLGSLCWQTLLIMNHSKRRFVEKCDFITTPGYLDGPGAREREGLPKESGPYRVITDLAILDFEDKSKRMRLLALYPGVTVEKVKENSGFELLLAPEILNLKPPAHEELKVLREEVDPLGMLTMKVSKAK